MKITLNKNKEYQTFEGFGASGAWWAQYAGGWTNTDPDSGMETRDRIVQLLYDKNNGIGLRTYRYNLGSGSAESGRGEYSDDARRAQSLEDASGNPDYSKDANAVYMMKKAAEYGADEVILFVNSPVERLTKNHMGHLGKTQVFRTNLSRKNYAAFADYCLNAAEHFISEGVPVKYLSPVNEPLWVWNGGQEGCHYSPLQAAEVMRVFARELAKRPALSGMKLSGVENGDIRWFNKSYTRCMLAFPEVRNAVDSVDVHSYFLHSPLPPFMNDRPAFLRRYRKWMDRHYPDVPVKMSEWTHMRGGQDRSMDSALETAKVMWEDISILNVTSWQHWLACSHYDYCDGLLYLDREKQTFDLTKRYWVTGNFSKFIPFGSIRFAVDCDDGEVMTLGFKNGKSTVVIIINPTEKNKNVTAPGDGFAAVTDENRDLEKTGIKENGTLAISPRSVTTLVF